MSPTRSASGIDIAIPLVFIGVVAAAIGLGWGLAELILRILS